MEVISPVDHQSIDDVLSAVPAALRTDRLLSEEEFERRQELVNDVLKKAINHRSDVLREILTTERNYVQDLSVLVCLYLKPLQVDESILSKEDIYTIFLNIEVIYKLSNEFLLMLETVLPDPDNIDPDTKLGTILMQIGHFLKMYSIYCSNYKVGLDHCTLCSKNYPAYAQFLRDTQTSPMCKGLSLYDYLIKPIQRLCKYPLLFGSLASHTPKDHPDYEAVLSTQALFQNVTETANKVSADKENMDKLTAFSITVDGFHDDNHFTCGRQLIRDEWMKVNSTKATLALCHIYLFNDLLIIAKRVHRKPTTSKVPKPQNLHKSERLKAQLLISNLVLKGECFDESKSPGFILAYNEDDPDDSETYTFSCSSLAMKCLWMEDFKKLLEDKKVKDNGEDKENLTPLDTSAKQVSEDRKPLMKKRSQMKLKAPDLLRQASKSKDLFIGVINNTSIKDDPLLTSREGMTSETRRIFRRVETSVKTSKSVVSFRDHEKTAFKERRGKDDSERGDKEARRERESQRKKDLENSRALALKKISDAMSSRSDHESSDAHDDEPQETNEHQQQDHDGRKLRQSKRKPPRAKRVPEKVIVSPRGQEENPDSLSPRDAPRETTLKKSKSIREMFFNGPRSTASSSSSTTSEQTISEQATTVQPVHQATENTETLREKFLKTKRNSKKLLETGLVSSKSADSVHDFPVHLNLPALPLLPTEYNNNQLSSTRQEEEIEESDEEDDNEKLNLEDILNMHILGGNTHQSCQTCRFHIPEGTSSILFQNRRYHLKCYICYHCHCSLLEHVPHMERDLLMCEDCHFALF